MSRRGGPARRQYGEGAIYSYTASGVERFRAQWSEPADPDYPDGGSRRRSKASFATKEAGAYLRDVLSKVNRGERTQAVASGYTLGEFMTEWLEGLRLEGTPVDGYRRLVRLHICAYPIANAPLWVAFHGKTAAKAYTQAVGAPKPGLGDLPGDIAGARGFVPDHRELLVLNSSTVPPWACHVLCCDLLAALVQ